jgi:antitoxin CptB
MQPEFGKLQWHCRRGLLELDILLNQFLSDTYSTLKDVDRHAFANLVALDDPELWQRISQPHSDEAGVPPSEQRVLNILRGIAKHKKCAAKTDEVKQSS